MFFAAPTGLEGFTPSEVTFPCVNRSGSTMAYGDVVMLDMAATVSELTTSSTDTYTPGKDGTVWTTVDTPDATGLTAGILGVVTEKDGMANDARGNVTFFGVVDAFCIRASGAINPGDRLVGTTAKNLDGVTLSNERVIAIAAAPASSPSTRALKQVFFNGLDFSGYAPPAT